MNKLFIFGIIFCTMMTVFAQDQDVYPIDKENPAVLKVLEDGGVNFEYPYYRHYTEPFKSAIEERVPLDVFEKLLSLGVKVEPDFTDYLHESPLMIAVQKENYEVVDFLIKNGADVNREHSRGRTPVFPAAELEDSKILERLIQAGGDVRKKNESGYTPLHMAAAYQRTENIKLLLSAKADINAKDNDGNTPLIMAVESFMATVPTVQALLSGKPDINAVNAQKQSALIKAAENVDDPEIITILLNAKANAKLEDNTGRTALDWFDMNKRINRSTVRSALKGAM